MNNSSVTRRAFLADVGRATVAGGLALQLPWIASLAGCSRAGESFLLFTPLESRAMRAFAAQIIPSEAGVPGAEEAGAIVFIERALALPFFADQAPIVRAGLAELDVRARAVGAREGFASLSHAQQIAIMHQIERDPFFDTMRTLVVIGTLADPLHGGNHNDAGWSMLGFDHQPSYSSPFGWYDAQVTPDPMTRAQ